MVLKKETSWGELAAAATGGWASFNTTRAIALAGLTAKGQEKLSFGNISLRAARQYGGADMWARPSIEVAGTVVHSNAFSETGAGPLNLNVAADDHDYWRVRPAVEFGREDKVGADLWLRSTLKLGASQAIAGRSAALAAGFADAPAGVAPFVIRSKLDATMAEGSVGMSLVNSKGASLKFTLTGQAGHDTHQESGSFKVIWPF